MRQILFFILTTLALTANDKVALVIGNKNYTNQTGLNNPINDAKLIKQTLEGLGFEVTPAYNKNLNGLSDILDAFIAKARNAKIAVVYYAGHGVGVGSKNYLIPIGASNLSLDNLPRKLMSVDELKGAVAKAQGFGVVLFDACRNSFFSGKISGLGSGRGNRALVQPTVSRTNVMVSYSTQAGAIAKDDVNNGEHSPYALALYEQFRAKPNTDIRQLMGSVRDRVLGITSNTQSPIEKNLLGGKQYCLSGSCGQEPQVRVVEKIVYRDRVVERKPVPVLTPTISTSKWIKPTNSVCKANGGKLYKGVCQANWKNATKICSASGGQLPSRADLKQVIVDCGGSFTTYGDKDWDSLTDKNIANKSYQSCYKQKGFSDNDWYWTREEKDSSYARSVNFNFGYDLWDYKSLNRYALCVR